jgi:glycerophosphoryl diester phosphodiesterase
VALHDTPLWQPGRVAAPSPLVIAHRGASAHEPEHTLAAYTEAIKVGADGLECDVRLTADGHLVCVHDRSVRRTSNGRGLVSTLELTELEGMDWGSWKAREDAGDEEPDVVTADDRSHLLTLKRLLSLVADSDRRVEVAIETKHPTRYGGLVERRLAELLEYFGWVGHPDGPVRVMSFSVLALRRMRLLAPAIPRVFLMKQVPLPYREGFLPPGVAVAGVSTGILRRHRAYVERFRDRGNSVFAFTVDDLADVDRCLEAGVEAVITNRPGDVLQHLGR